MATISFFHQNKQLDRRIQETEVGRILNDNDNDDDDDNDDDNDDDDDDDDNADDDDNDLICLLVSWRLLR